MENKQILNPVVLDSYGPALAAILGKLVSAGFGDIQLQIETLQNLGGETDKGVMVRAAHSIKSCSAQLGGEILSEFSMGKEQQYSSDDLSTLDADIGVFIEMFDDLKRAMDGVLVERGIE